MFNLGITGRGAEMVDKEKRGGEMVLTIASRGYNKRAAVRAARIEATGIIPLREQHVTRTVVDRELRGRSTRYLVTVGEK